VSIRFFEKFRPYYGLHEELFCALKDKKFASFKKKNEWRIAGSERERSREGREEEVGENFFRCWPV
jgi:hypothetical protein